MFVIRFHTSNLEPDPVERLDPVTGVVRPFAVDRGLTKLEKMAVADRLRMRGATGPDAFGRSRLQLPGGATATLEFPDLAGDSRCGGGTLAAAEPIFAWFALAFDLATAGNLLLVVDGLPRPVALTELVRHRLLARWPSLIVVPTLAGLWKPFAPPPDPEPEPP